jgi:hypothetical protein
VVLSTCAHEGAKRVFGQGHKLGSTMVCWVEVADEQVVDR